MEKYISVADAKSCALARHSDPIIRSAIYGVLDDTPAAEVAPMVPGRWDPSSSYYGFRCCSVCGGTIQFDDDDVWPFCPRCGHPMEVEPQ